MRRKLLAVAFGLTLLWLTEVALRLGGVQAAYQPSTDAGWKMAENLRDHRMQGTREPHDFRVSTNADGLRTALLREGSGSRRLAIMGDSNVFGWGVQEEHTLARQMEEHLPGWEVLNAGQPGYTTWQVGWLYEQVLRDYEPDVVLVWMPMADHNRAVVSDRERIEGGPRLLLARHSRIYALLRTLVWSRADQEYLLPHEDGDGEPRVPRVSVEERRQVLEAIQASGATLALGLLPFYQDLCSSQVPPRPGAEEAIELASELGALLVDIRTCCASSVEQADAMTFPFDRGHLNGLGNDPAGEEAALSLLQALGEPYQPVPSQAQTPPEPE